MTRDAGRDAGRRDAGRDSGPRDAGRDAGRRDGGPAGWTPIEGLPSGCVVERAQHPEVLFVPTWEPCDATGPWCRRLPFGTLVLDQGAADASGGHFLVLKLDETGRRVVVFARTDAPPWAALRSEDVGAPPRPPCEHSQYAVSPVAGAASVLSFPRDGATDAVLHAVVLRGWSDRPVALLDEAARGGTSVIQGLAVSATTLAIDVQPSARAFVWRSGSLDRVPPIAGDTSTSYFQPVVIASDVLVHESRPDGMTRIVRVGEGEAPEPYYAASDAEVVELSSDGIDLAWLQIHRRPDSTVERVELWTGRYATNALDFRPRLLATLPEQVVNVTVGGGKVALHLVTPPARLVVFDIETAQASALDEWADIRFGAIPYVTGADLLVWGSNGGMMGVAGRTAFRVDLASAPLYDATADFAGP